MITTIGIFSTKMDAEFAVSELHAFGTKDEDISIIVGKSVTVGFVGSLTKLGIGHKDAMRFQDYIRSGDFLVIVRVKSLGHKEILMRAHAREVQEYVH